MTRFSQAALLKRFAAPYLTAGLGRGLSQTPAGQFDAGPPAPALGAGPPVATRQFGGREPVEEGFTQASAQGLNPAAAAVTSSEMFGSGLSFVPGPLGVPVPAVQGVDSTGRKTGLTPIRRYGFRLDAPSPAAPSAAAPTAEDTLAGAMKDFSYGPFEDTAPGWLARGEAARRATQAQSPFGPLRPGTPNDQALADAMNAPPSADATAAFEEAQQQRAAQQAAVQQQTRLNQAEMMRTNSHLARAYAGAPGREELGQIPSMQAGYRGLAPEGGRSIDEFGRPVVGDNPWQPTMPMLGNRAASVERDLAAQDLAKGEFQAGRDQVDSPLYGNADRAAQQQAVAAAGMDPELILGSDDETDVGPLRLTSPGGDVEANKRRAGEIGNYTDRMRASVDALKRAAKAQADGNTKVYKQEVAAAAAMHPGPMGSPTPFKDTLGNRTAAEISQERFSSRRARLGQPLDRADRALAAADDAAKRHQRVVDRGMGTSDLDIRLREAASPEERQSILDRMNFGIDRGAMVTAARAEQPPAPDDRAAAAALYATLPEDPTNDTPETARFRAGLIRRMRAPRGLGPSPLAGDGVAGGDPSALPRTRQPTPDDWEAARLRNPTDVLAELQREFSDEAIEASRQSIMAQTQQDLKAYDRIGTPRDPQFYVPGWGLGRFFGKLGADALTPLFTGQTARFPKGKKLPEGMTR